MAKKVWTSIAILGLMLSMVKVAHAFPSYVDRQYIPGTNLIVNGGFENDKKAWTASAGSFAINTTAANIGLGNASGSWDASAGSQTLRSDAATIPAGLYGRSCVAHFIYKGGDSNLTAQVLDGSNNVLASQALSAQSGFYGYDIPFICPSSGSLKFGLSSGADAAIIYLDEVYVGSNSPAMNVAQSQIVAKAYIPKTASCTWTLTDTSGNLADFPTNASCPGPTIEYGGTGVWSAQTTDADLPQLTVNNLPPGDYLVKIGVSVASSSGTLRLAVSDGTTNSGEIAPQQTINTVGLPHVLMGYFNYTSSGNRTFRVRASELVSSQVIIHTETAANAGGGNLQFEIIRFPSGSDLAQSVTATPASWSGYHSNDCDWTMTATTFADPNGGADAGCTFAELKNRNFGTVVTYGSSLPGIVFTPPRVGRYLVTAVTGLSNTGANYVSARLTDGSGNEFASAMNLLTNVSNAITTATLSGILDVTSIASTTVKIQVATSAGTLHLGAGGAAVVTNSRSISWSVVELDAPMPAPFLVNSVRSSYGGILAMEYVKLATGCTINGLCAITSQSTSATVTRTGLGLFTVAWPAGTFSATPACSCRIPGGSGDNLCEGGLVAESSTSTSFKLANTTSTGQDIAADIVCVGQR